MRDRIGNTIYIIKEIIRIVSRVFFVKRGKQRIVIISSSKDVWVEERLKYYTIGIDTQYSTNTLKYYFNKQYFLIVNGNSISTFKRLALNARGRVYYISSHKPYAAWELARLSFDLSFNNDKDIAETSSALFASFVKRNASNDSCLILGTGPSLSKVLSMDYPRDAVVIGCNTIVKDTMLIKSINCQVIVAGDAVYHFSDTSYAVQFRQDVLKAMFLKEDLIFCYPMWFHALVLREFVGVSNRLMPIPTSREDKMYNLNDDYRLPNRGNVLNNMQIPLATSIKKYIYMCGYDGRSPNDTGFWNHSDKHNYSELMTSIRSIYPAFLDNLIPKGRESEYSEEVQGDYLDKLMTKYENIGYKFIMLHQSNSQTLNRRFKI